MKATDEREQPIFIHHELDDAGLDPYAFRIYCRIARRAGTGGDGCTESIRNMADGCEMSYKRAKKALKTLQVRGMIAIANRPGYTNEVTLLTRGKGGEADAGDPRDPGGENAPGAKSPPGETNGGTRGRNQRGDPGAKSPPKDTPSKDTPFEESRAHRREAGQGGQEEHIASTRNGQTQTGKDSGAAAAGNEAGEQKANAEKEGEHWALALFRRQMEKHKRGLDYCDVQPFAQDKITATVTDRDAWEKIISKGLTRGWSHSSVDAFLDHYQREEEHQRKTHTGGDGTPSSQAFVRGEDGLSPYERSRQRALERQAREEGREISAHAGRLS
jgi:hypothetical protein